jgi:hypothetical protein
MIPVDQALLHDPDNGVTGDCLRACFASIFELPSDEVPHFVAEDDWPNGLDRFLQPRGYSYISVNFSEWGKYWPRNAYVVWIGESPRSSDLKHAVVAYNGEIIHDPHPSRSGLVGEPTSMYVVVVQNPTESV